MTFREALTTEDGVPFFRTPRATAQWLAEWLIIGSARLEFWAWHAYYHAGRTDLADDLYDRMGAWLSVEDRTASDSPSSDAQVPDGEEEG